MIPSDVECSWRLLLRAAPVGTASPSWTRLASTRRSDASPAANAVVAFAFPYHPASVSAASAAVLFTTKSLSVALAPSAGVPAPLRSASSAEVSVLAVAVDSVVGPP